MVSKWFKKGEKSLYFSYIIMLRYDNYEFTQVFSECSGFGGVYGSPVYSVCCAFE